MRHAQSLLNDRHYEEAVSFLSDLLARDASDHEIAGLLAEAHLGAAGFELLPAINAVMASQDSTPLGLHAEPSCTTEAVKKLTDLDYKCLLYRVMRRIPSADNPHLLASQALFRRYFPDPEQAGSGRNFVAGLVEIISALSRIRVLYDAEMVRRMDEGLRIDPTRFPYDPVIRHTKRALVEINLGLARFRRSYGKFHDIIEGFEGKNILTIENRSLRFDGTVQASDILRFLADVARDDVAPLDRYLSELATRKLRELRAGVLEMIQTASPGSVSGGTPAEAAIELQFGAYVNQLLTGLADSMDKEVTITFAELLWSNPPPIVRDFLEAAETAWDQESGDPLLAYYASSETEWRELKDIGRAWDAWLNQDMTPATKSAVLAKVAGASALHAEALKLPATFEPASLSKWVSGVSGFLSQAITALPVGIPPECLAASPPPQCLLLLPPGTTLPPGAEPPGADPALSPPLPPLPMPDPATLMPPQMLEADRLLKWTDAWMTRNFYPMADWVELH